MAVQSIGIATTNEYRQIGIYNIVVVVHGRNRRPRESGLAWLL